MSMAWKPPKLTGRRSTDISGIILLLIVAIAVVSALRERGDGEADPSALAPGEPLPAYAAYDRDGTAVSLETYRGKVVLLTFWTRDCSACVDQFDAMRALKAEIGDSGLELVSVNLEGGDQESVQSYLDALGYDWANLFDDPEHVSQLFAWGARLPKSVLVNRDGTVAAWWRGSMDPGSTESRAIIDEAMAAPGGSGAAT